MYHKILRMSCLHIYHRICQVTGERVQGTQGWKEETWGKTIHPGTNHSRWRGVSVWSSRRDSNWSRKKWCYQKSHPVIEWHYWWDILNLKFCTSVEYKMICLIFCYVCSYCYSALHWIALIWFSVNPQRSLMCVYLFIPKQLMCAYM